MASYVVYLKNNSFLVVPEAWIQNPVLGIVSKVYFSNNLADARNFTSMCSWPAATKHLFIKNSVSLTSFS